MPLPFSDPTPPDGPESITDRQRRQQEQRQRAKQKSQRPVQERLPERPAVPAVYLNAFREEEQ